MKVKNLLPLFLTTVSLIFLSCDKDNSDDNTSGNSRKGVHKIEVTVTSQFSDITTVLSYAGIGKDGVNANAALYNESGEKCGDGSYVRTVKNGIGKFLCYTNSEATGLMCAIGVSIRETGKSATMTAVAYINDKEVSRIERTITPEDYGSISIQTNSID